MGSVREKNMGWCYASEIRGNHSAIRYAAEKCNVKNRPLILIIIIIKTMFMVLSSWQSHCESSPGSFDECRTAPSGRRPKTKPDDLGCESACTGCQSLHSSSPFIIITQSESWYSFYRSTEGGWVDLVMLLVTSASNLPMRRIKLYLFFSLRRSRPC